MKSAPPDRSAFLPTWCRLSVYGLTIDRSGNLFATDTGTDATYGDYVVKFAASGGLPSNSSRLLLRRWKP